MGACDFLSGAEPIEFGGRVMEQRRAFFGGKPLRHTFEGVPQHRVATGDFVHRKIAFDQEFDSLLLQVYDQTIHYVVNKGYLIHPHSMAGRNELIMKGVKNNSWNIF
jgi:hypothetical protein